MAEKNRGGRPPKWTSVEDLQKQIDSYFESCYEERWEFDNECGWYPVIDRNGNVIKDQTKPFTITGLALHLGTNRTTLMDYESNKDKFSNTIKMAKARCEEYVERLLLNTNSKNSTGPIFNLKNNFGWKDKVEQDINANVEYAVVPPPMPNINNG